MYYLNMQQSLALRAACKADTQEFSVEDYAVQVAQQANVELPIAIQWISAWRWNHSEEGRKYKAPVAKKEGVQRDPALGGGIVAQIIKHAESGLTVKEIVALGFNRSTVSRQVGEWKKRNNIK